MTTTPFDHALAVLAPAVKRLRATRLRPEAFFVARAGVLTLAYKGFSDPILEIKREVERLMPTLPSENPGSQWPKTTLAALAGDEPLTVDEVVLLKEATEIGTVCLARGRYAIAAETLVLVELACRSMERTGRYTSLPLEGGSDTGTIQKEHRSAVNTVLTQWRREGLSKYMPELTRSGYRERHYREERRELSLVIPMSGAIPCLDRFREAVESRLAGRYAWFATDSLHITVRSLGGETDE